MDLFIPDYSKYSKKELMEIYLDLDKQKEPELASLLEEEMKMRVGVEDPVNIKRRFSLPLFFDFTVRGRKDQITKLILVLGFITMITSSIISLTGHTPVTYIAGNIIFFVLMALHATKSIAGVLMLVMYILYHLYNILF